MAATFSTMGLDGECIFREMLTTWRLLTKFCVWICESNAMNINLSSGSIRVCESFRTHISGSLGPPVKSSYRESRAPPSMPDQWQPVLRSEPHSASEALPLPPPSQRQPVLSSEPHSASDPRPPHHPSEWQPVLSSEPHSASAPRPQQHPFKRQRDLTPAVD